MPVLFLIAVSVPAAAPEKTLDVSARIEADALDVGQTYAITLDVKLEAGLSAAKAGVPAPILQIDVPRSVTLAGKELRTYRDLSRNEFLQKPYERLLKKLPARIEFKVREAPAADDRFGLSVLAYVASTGDGASFVRRRLELPVKPGAEATIVSPDQSHWGKDKSLQIGDKAVAFTLPKADGSTLSLKQYLGKKNLIVTTYRAFW